MKAIIVAGGRGERLRPLTNSIPKPMISIGGKPILEHNILHLKKYGVNQFILALCYLPHEITDYFGDGTKLGITIRYTYEDKSHPMGTAGAVLAARSVIDDTCIITYADILRSLDVGAMIREHKHHRALATLHVYKRYGNDPKSMVLFDTRKRITKFIERPRPDQLSEDYVWANGSFYIAEPDIFDSIPLDQPSDFGKNIFPLLLSQKKPLYAFPSDGYFADIGTMTKLTVARQTYPRYLHE